MSTNLIHYETERQRQDRLAALIRKRDEQRRRNRLEWIDRMCDAANRGDIDRAQYILDTQLRGA